MDPSVLVAGETLIDFLPESESSLAANREFTRNPGGAPANVAVRLSQLDRTPWFWTRVGADPFGDFLVDALTERGLPGRFVERDAEAKTTLAFISDDPEAVPRFTFYRHETADTRFQPGRVPDDVLASVDWVVLGSVLLACPPSREAMHDLAERASDRDCTVVFDLNARPELWSEADFERQVRRILPSIDVMKTSLEELPHAGVTGDGPMGLAGELHELGPHTVFLTRGERGSAASATAAAPWGAGEATHDGYAVETVDVTGSGDAFTAGVVNALADGQRDLDGVLAHANAVAAASTTRAGGMAALADLDTVL
jgi:fructokinase